MSTTTWEQITIVTQATEDDTVHVVCCIDNATAMCGVQCDEDGTDDQPTCWKCELIEEAEPHYCPLGFDCEAVLEIERTVGP